MIVIIDNGAAYSNHKIHFVDIGKAPPDVVLPILLKMIEPGTPGYSDGAFVLGTAESIAWRAPATVDKLEEYWIHANQHSGDCPVWLDMSERRREAEERGSRKEAYEAWERKWDTYRIHCTCDCGKLRDALRT